MGCSGCHRGCCLKAKLMQQLGIPVVIGSQQPAATHQRDGPSAPTLSTPRRFHSRKPNAVSHLATDLKWRSPTACHSRAALPKPATTARSRKSSSLETPASWARTTDSTYWLTTNSLTQYLLCFPLFYRYPLLSQTPFVSLRSAKP